MCWMAMVRIGGRVAACRTPALRGKSGGTKWSRGRRRGRRDAGSTRGVWRVATGWIGVRMAAWKGGGTELMGAPTVAREGTMKGVRAYEY